MNLAWDLTLGELRDLLLRLRMRAKGGTTGAARVAKSQADTVAK